MEFKDFDDFCKVNEIPDIDILRTESYSIATKNDGYFYFKDSSMEYGQFIVYDYDGIISKVEDGIL